MPIAAPVPNRLSKPAISVSPAKPPIPARNTPAKAEAEAHLGSNHRENRRLHHGEGDPERRSEHSGSDHEEP